MIESGRSSRALGPGASNVVIGLTLAAAVVVPSVERGGFTANGQILFVILAAVLLLAVVLLVPEVMGAAMRMALAPLLLLLGVLAAFSATWTIGPTDVALRWGLVIVAYGVIAVSAFALTRRMGLWPIAIGIAILAALEALLGLGAAALHKGPWAELIGGSWRPGGTFEYAASLGLLEVCALPVALRAASSPSSRLTYVGASVVVLAGATLGCTDSRMDLGLAVLTLIFLGCFADQRQLPRRVLLASSALLALAAVAGALVLGRHTSAAAAGGGDARLIGITLACLALAGVWPVFRALAWRLEVRRMAAIAGVVILVGGAIWLAVGFASTLVTAGHGLDHGRLSYWKAAVKAWEQRPIIGSGVGTFAEASARYQASDDPTLFAHNLPLELATELGLLGFVAGVLLYVAAARTLLRAIKVPNAWLVAPTVACFLLANLVDWPWHLAGMGAAWAAAAGALGVASAGRREAPFHDPP